MEKGGYGVKEGRTNWPLLVIRNHAVPISQVVIFLWKGSHAVQQMLFFSRTFCGGVSGEVLVSRHNGFRDWAGGLVGKVLAALA